MQPNRPSSISRLPEEIRAKIALLREQGRTLDEIMKVLDELDVEISRSALGRHTRKLDRIAADMRRSRDLAQAITRQFGDQEASLVARTNIEMMHGILMKVLIGSEDGQDVVLDAKDAMFMGKAFESLAKASKLDLDAQIAAIKESERQAATSSAADTAAAVARERGLSEDTVDLIKKRILGVE